MTRTSSDDTQEKRQIVGLIAWQVPFQKEASDEQLKPIPESAFPVRPVEIDSIAWKALEEKSAKYRPPEDPDNRNAHLQILIVKKSHQRRGLGSLLMEHFLTNANVKGRTTFLMSQPEAVQLYKRHGFVVTAQGLEDGGILMPSLAHEEKGTRRNWPMILNERRQGEEKIIPEGQ
ncbi:hypothetical protein CBS101457_003042 [Exobasidium rhododendri]|nr:hypothetical protein CBS101457_003042 [Exobasidium rhododendri]